MLDDVHSAPDVVDLVPEAAHFFGEGLQRVLLSDSDLDALESPAVTIYVCRELLSFRRRYVSLAWRLVRSGLFRLLHAHEAREHVGIFPVQEGLESVGSRAARWSRPLHARG